MTRIDFDDLNIRVMLESDLDAIIEIDTKVSGLEREAYYQRKMADFLHKESTISLSLVADYKGKILGFIMGNLYTGEFGIPDTTAFLDTVGIDPNYQKMSIGTMLMEEFQTSLKGLGVKRVRTLVDWDDLGLIKFFSKTGFTPSATLSLEKAI